LNIAIDVEKEKVSPRREGMCWGLWVARARRNGSC